MHLPVTWQFWQFWPFQWSWIGISSGEGGGGGYESREALADARKSIQ